MDAVDVRVQLLGPISVEVDGHPVTGFRSLKTLALLAYLVAERRPVARNYLATLFWPDAATAVGRGHLRRALHDLVQKLPGALWLDYHTAQFNPALFAYTDLAQLDQQAFAEDETSLEPTTSLGRGQFLEGVELPDCPVFETWLLVEREAWNHKVSELLEGRLSRRFATGQFQQALEIGWQLLRLSPWNEDYYRRQMLLLVRLGQFGQAIGVYQRYQRLLARELGLEPSAEIEELHARICDSRKRPPGNIAPNSSPPPDQSQEVATLLRDLVDPACRIITLTCPADSDKDQVALAAGAQANGPSGHLFLEGAFQVQLEGATTPADVLTRVAQALGLICGAGPVVEEMVLRRLRGREILLLLCGFDHLRAHKDILLGFLRANPSLKLVVTCRERLGLPGERVCAIKSHAQTIARGTDVPEPSTRFYFPALAQQVLARALMTEHYLMI